MMWPMYVDYSDDECRQVLRSLQLEAYANVVSALRAQGSFTKEKKKMLQELSEMFDIPVPRHKAEIRRAVNDEHLNTIAERLYGPNTSTEWSLEGRRIVPLMPRIPPQTLFTTICDSLAIAQNERNAMLPPPGQTGVRKMEGGLETMASRKRKEFPSESLGSPSKNPFDLSEMESRYISSLISLENTSNLFETNQTTSGFSESEAVPPPDGTSQNSSSCTEQSVAKTSVSPPNTGANTSGCLIKPPPKQIMLKSSPTVTFSSLEQLSSNLAGKSASHIPIITTVKEEPISSSDTPKVIDTKSLTTSAPSITLKAPSFISSSASCSNTSSASDNLSSSGSTPPAGNKFLTQVRCKNTGSARQNLSLGLKLNPQSQMSPKVLSSKPLSNIKIKQENPSGFFTKKLPQTVFSSSSSDSQNPASSSSITDTSLAKAPICIPKPTLKTEPLVVCSSQSSPKITAVTKSFPKTSSPGSMTRSLFSSATKAKTLPVIFNVSSISCTPLQTSAKTTTISVSSDSTKTSQLLPKSTSVGLTASPLKLSSSHAQTIQYRNDGGVVRSARIVSLAQPVVSRLPCAAISTSTISSLGLASNLTSSGLRASLPSGTLCASMPVRISAAAKPNVIVVHKAQLPRTQQGTAVIVSSVVSPSKKSYDVSETASLAQKSEKSKMSGTMLGSKAKINIPPASSAVTAATVKNQDPTLSSKPLATKSLHQAIPVSSDNLNLKPLENTEKLKKNLLGDVTETSRALESSVIKLSPSFKKPLPPTPSAAASATIKISDPSLLASSFINKSQPDSSVSSDILNSKLHNNTVTQCKKRSSDVVEISEISESSSKNLPVNVKKSVISSLIFPPAISASAVKPAETSILAGPFASKTFERDLSFENLRKRALTTDAAGTSKIVESPERKPTCGKSPIPKGGTRSFSVIQPQPCCSRNTGSTSSVASLGSKEGSLSSSERKKAIPKGGSSEKSAKKESIINFRLRESKEISESLVSSTSELEKVPSSESEKSPSSESEISPPGPAEPGSSLQPDSTVKKT